MGRWQQLALRQRVPDAQQRPEQPFEDFAYAADFSGAGPRRLRLYGRALVRHGGQPGRLLLRAGEE